MSRANKKQRHKARREAKRRENRRKESISPVKCLADEKGEIECWLSDDVESFGQVQILVHKRTAGLSGVACFLVDQGVVGLMDVWTRIRVDRAEFDSMVEKSGEHGIPMRRGTLDEARRWIAGGVRWAHENGMRLPKDWAKAASVIGGVGDWATADVSEFLMEFAGRPDDLRRRLIGQPFDEFIRRTDIRFIFNESAPMMDIQSGEYEDDEADFDAESILGTIPENEQRLMLEASTAHAAAMSALTANWLAARNEKSASQLLEAWKSVMLASGMASYAVPDPAGDEGVDLFELLLDGFRQRIEPDRLAEYDWAVEQTFAHLNSDPKLPTSAAQQNLAENEQVDRFIHVERSTSQDSNKRNFDSKLSTF